MHNNIFPYSLSDIANWQLKDENSGVELPALQRGFVWKASQIESLWDSLLRGYPVGSFLLSQSDDGKMFLMDGQQRATSVALGFYDPWQADVDKSFWSISRIPTVWIDLQASNPTNQHKFVIRVLTTSHPWGYQRVNHNEPLSVADKRRALEIMNKLSDDTVTSYLKIKETNRIPYDAYCPVPLIFLINAIWQHGTDWKAALVSCSRKHLSMQFGTKHLPATSNYIDHIETVLNEQSDKMEELYRAVNRLQGTSLPGLVISGKVLKSDSDFSGDDPTLFVRLNAAGTRIAGEELIYSIYKASFPQAKDLVESIGNTFMAPSLVISLASRLVISEMSDSYPPPLQVKDFIKRIDDSEFRDQLKSMIGSKVESPARTLFEKATDILQAKGVFDIPPVLIKKIVRDSPDLFLMLLKWLRVWREGITLSQQQHVLAGMTALSWFGRNNVRFVRESWPHLKDVGLWSKDILGRSFIVNKEVLMYPLIRPEMLSEFLKEKISEDKARNESVTIRPDDHFTNVYRQVLRDTPFDSEEERFSVALSMWSNFIWKLKYCKPMVLFAQKAYINARFFEYNQLDDLEDTNAPWDWDHIYPSSWVYMQQKVDESIRQWNNTIGNLRAISLEENRSDGNHYIPGDRLGGTEKESFISSADLFYWSRISGRIYKDDDDGLSNYLHAVTLRMINIYQHWYNTLNIGELFDYSEE
jgi:hypothetical protein